MEKRRIGMKSGEVICLCKLSGEGQICSGVSCPRYNKCWEYLNPNKDGYIEFEFKTIDGMVKCELCGQEIEDAR